MLNKTIQTSQTYDTDVVHILPRYSNWMFPELYED